MQWRGNNIGKTLAHRAAVPRPRSRLEKQLAAIWRELLGLKRRVGVHDDFFALGGRALLAVRMMARAREATGVALPVAALFAGPTIAELAAAMEAARRGETDAEPAVMPLVEELAASLMAPSTAGGQSAGAAADGRRRAAAVLHSRFGRAYRRLSCRWHADWPNRGRSTGCKGKALIRAKRRTIASRTWPPTTSAKSGACSPAGRTCWPAGRWAA